jgi:hypothetical protein
MRLKRQPKEWEKVFTNYILDKGLITRIHRQLKTLNAKKPKDNSQKKKNKWPINRNAQHPWP